MLISDLPPDMPIAEVRYYCSVESSLHYGLPPELIYAVALTEGGKPNSRSKNSNGTYDLGYMQFNTRYLEQLKQFGIKPEDVQQNSCYPFHLAAWRIRGHLEEPGDEDIYTKAAYYHSRTPAYNEVYRDKLIINAGKFDYKKGTEYLNLIIKNESEEDVKTEEKAQSETVREEKSFDVYADAANKLLSHSSRDYYSLKRSIEDFASSIDYVEAM